MVAHAYNPSTLEAEPGGLYKLETRLDYIVSSKPAQVTELNPPYLIKKSISQQHFFFWGALVLFYIYSSKNSFNFSLPTHTYTYSSPCIQLLRIELACIQESLDAFKKSGDYFSGFSSLLQEGECIVYLCGGWARLARGCQIKREIWGLFYFLLNQIHAQ